MRGLIARRRSNIIKATCWSSLVVAGLILCAGITPTAAQSNGCEPGYVPRLTTPQDKVCVTSQTAAQVIADNKAAAQRVVHGTDTCIKGYVWRQATPTDHVCVASQTRTQTVADNAAAASRVAETTTTTGPAEPPAPTTAPVSVPTVTATYTFRKAMTASGIKNVPIAHTNPPPVEMLPAPTGLTSTLDAPTCTQHAGVVGGLVCNSLTAQGDLALIWSYNANTPDVTGFRVYRVDGGQYKLVNTGTGGASVTLAVFPPQTGGTPCYEVAAYSSSGDGVPSPQYCPGANSTYQVIQVIPDPITLGTWFYTAFGAPASPPDGGYSVGSLMAGYSSTHDSGGLLSFTSLLYLTTSPSFHQFISAHLKMNVVSATVGPNASNTSVNSTTSCVAMLAEVPNVWPNTPYWNFPEYSLGAPGGITGANAPNPPDMTEQGPQVSWDITPWITDFLNHDTWGFVLLGRDVLDGSSTGNWTPRSDVCVTTFDPKSVILEFEYQ
jgi:hypothetical protein